LWRISCTDSPCHAIVQHPLAAQAVPHPPDPVRRPRVARPCPTRACYHHLPGPWLRPRGDARSTAAT